MEKGRRLLCRHLMLVWLVFMSVQLQAQSKKISVTGTTVNENGKPIPMATVQIINQDSTFRKTTISDEKGIFYFSNLSAGMYRFKISSTGYFDGDFTGYNYDGQHEMTVSLSLASSSGQLNDIVVVGYGTQKKINLTGAVSQIDGKIFNDKPVANIAQTLQGQIPNLNINFSDGHPGSGGNFNIRGMASINDAGGSPLILIDGVPGDINMINPQDVASISVLKDAASAAIYGARGSFGVILVTTKNGQAGKIKINYNSNYGIQTQTTRTDFVTDGFTMDSLVDVSFSRHNGNSYTGFNDDDYAALKKRQTDKSLPSVVTQNRTGKDQYVYYGSTDWYHWLFRNSSPSMAQNISVTGGSDKVNFLISGRYFEQSGMYQPYLRTDKYHSYNFRSKINAKITSWFNLYTNTQFAANDYTWPGYGINTNYFNFAVHALASYVPTNPDGTYTYVTNLNNYNIGNGIYADLQHGKTKGGNNNYKFSNTVGFDMTLFKNFVLSGNYTYELAPYSDYQRRTVISYSIYPGVVSTVGNDNLVKNSYQDQHHTANLYGTYEQNYGKHHAKLMLGYNQELMKFSTNSGSVQNLLSEDLNQLSLGTGLQQTSGTANELALLGFFGRFNYDYAGKYLLEVDARYDGTSRFPSYNRFGFFPSVSGGWRISQEKFFASLKPVISEWKLRISYGSLGNQYVGNNYYPYVPLMSNGTSNWLVGGNQLQTISQPAPVSPNFTWEKAATLDFGTDINFLKNKLQIVFDKYTRKTTNMLVNGKTLPAVFGAGSPRQNAGSLETKGFDLSVSWHDQTMLLHKPFTYNFGFVLGDYTAQITKFDNPSKLLSNYYVGQQIGEIWGYTIDGFFKTDQEAQNYNVDQSAVNTQIKSSPGEWNKLHAGDMKFVDLNGDKIINQGKNTVNDHGDLRRIGNTLPRYSYGITGGFNWMNVDMSFAFQGIGKQNWFPGSDAGMFWGPYARPYFSFIPKTMLGQMWTPQNPNSYFPLLRGYEAYSGGGELHSTNDRYLQNLAYLRLKNITLGYSLPPKIINHLGIQRFRVYFSGQNLLTFTKFKSKYIDPEQVASGASDATNGNDYPYFKNYAFGVDILF